MSAVTTLSTRKLRKSKKGGGEEEGGKRNARYENREICRFEKDREAVYTFLVRFRGT